MRNSLDFLIQVEPPPFAFFLFEKMSLAIEGSREDGYEPLRKAGAGQFPASVVRSAPRVSPTDRGSPLTCSQRSLLPAKTTNRICSFFFFFFFFFHFFPALQLRPTLSPSQPVTCRTSVLQRSVLLQLTGNTRKDRQGICFICTRSGFPCHRNNRRSEPKNIMHLLLS